MIKQLMTVCCALTFFSSAYALGQISPITPPQSILPTEHVRHLLTQDPSVAAARANLEVARQEDGLLRRSPYEWTAKIAAGQRSVKNDARYTEWNMGIERPIRLPRKATADQRLGKVVIAESEARYGDALHESARELLNLWLNWLTAENAQKLANLNLQSMESSYSAVEKRVRAGDASKLDLNLAQAELAEQKRMSSEAKTQVLASWAQLSSRFPSFNQSPTELPMPLPVGQNPQFWHTRILEESEVLKISQLKMQRAQAHVEQLNAERIPDPTFGVYTASEVSGRERLVGVSLSMPIPTGLRDSRAAKARAEVEVLRHEVEHTKRQLNSGVSTAIVMTQGLYDTFHIASDNAKAMQNNADLTQRAFSLGEADLQSLLAARRQATMSANHALQAQSAALISYMGLMIDAHLVWNLEQE